MRRKLVKREDILKAFERKQADILLRILDMLDDLVRAKDFNELKEIVRELAEAQKRTEERINELAEAQRRTEEMVKELAEAQKRTEERISKVEERVTKLETAVHELAEAQKRTEQRVNELAEAQKRTEQRVNELAEAQKRTEQRVNELAEAQKRTEEEIRELTKLLNRMRTDFDESITNLRKDFGGFQRSISYAFENEAFRMIPGVLKEKYGIEVSEKFIRKDVKGKEINLFGKGKMNGKEVIIIGEAKIRLEEKGKDQKEKTEWIEGIFNELEEKVKAVEEEYRGIDIVRILITHFATNTFLEEARKRGVIVIQSFEW